VQDRIARRDRLDVGEKALRHRDEVRVRDLDALRPAGRAARVEQPRGRIGSDRRRIARGDPRQRLVLGATDHDAALERRDREAAERGAPLLVDERPARAGIAEHPGELLRVQLRVHRHGEKPRPPAREQRVEVRGMIAGDDRDAVARRESRRAHACGVPGDARRERRVAVQHARAFGDRGQRGPRAGAPCKQRRDVARRRRFDHGQRSAGLSFDAARRSSRVG